MGQQLAPKGRVDFGYLQPKVLLGHTKSVA